MQLYLFSSVFLLNLAVFGLSLTHEEQLLDSSSTVADGVSKVSNNTAVKTTQKNFGIKHHAVLEETNLDNTSRSKDKLQKQNEFILSEHDLVNSKDDTQEEIVTFTSVVTSRSILIHDKDGVTHIRPVLHNGQIFIQNEVSSTTPFTTPSADSEPSEVMDIDEEAIKEVDNTEDMSKLLGEELPIGKEQEIAASMEELFNDKNEEIEGIDKVNDKDNIGIIGEWMKQKYDKTLDVIVPQISVITNEDIQDLQFVESSDGNIETTFKIQSEDIATSAEIPLDAETAQIPIKFNISNDTLEPSKESTELPKNTQVESGNKGISITECVTIPNPNKLDESISTTTEDSSDIKMTTEIRSETTTELLNSIEFETTTLQEEVSDLNSDTSTIVPQDPIKYQTTASVDSAYISVITKRTIGVTPDMNEDDNLKVIPLIEEVATVLGSNKEFVGGTTKRSPMEVSTEIFVSPIRERHRNQTVHELVIDEEVKDEIKLVDVVKQLKEEIQEEKEELEYFEGLVKGTTVIPSIITSKTSRISNAAHEINDQLNVVPLDKSFVTDSTTAAANDATVVFRTTLALAGTVDHVSDADLIIGVPSNTLRGNLYEIDDKILNLTTEYRKLEKELDVVPLDQVQIEQVTKAMNIDVIIDGDKEIESTSSKNGKTSTTKKVKYLDSSIQDSKEITNGITTRTLPNIFEFHHQMLPNSSIQDSREITNGITTRILPNIFEFHRQTLPNSSIQDSREITNSITTRTLPNIFEFHHQTLDETATYSTTSKAIVTTKESASKIPSRPLSITELVKQALEAGERENIKPTTEDVIANDSKEISEGISNIDYDYGSQEKLTKPVKPVELLGGVTNEELVNSFQSQTPETVESIEAIDYGSSEEDFPPFTRDFSHPSHFPRNFNDGFDQSFEESQKVPVVIKVPTTTVSYRSIDEISKSGLQDIIAQAVMKGINAVTTKLEEVKKDVMKPLEEDYDENNEGGLLDEVLVQEKNIIPLQQVLEVQEDPIQDLVYDSAETDKEVHEIDTDRKLAMIHRDLYFDEDLTSYLSVNFSIKITLNNMDYLIPKAVNLQANNSESTVFLDLTWPSSNAASSPINHVTFKLEKGGDILQIDGIVLDMHVNSTSQGIVEHLRLERNQMNIVEWSQGEFEIKLGRGNVLHLAYMDLVLNEKDGANDIDAATFQQKLTSGTALLIVAVTFGSSVTAIALGYLIYIKCRSKANVFKVDLP